MSEQKKPVELEATEIDQVSGGTEIRPAPLPPPPPTTGGIGSQSTGAGAGRITFNPF